MNSTAYMSIFVVRSEACCTSLYDLGHIFLQRISLVMVLVLLKNEGGPSLGAESLNRYDVVSKNVALYACVCRVLYCQIMSMSCHCKRILKRADSNAFFGGEFHPLPSPSRHQGIQLRKVFHTQFSEPQLLLRLRK